MLTDKTNQTEKIGKVYPSNALPIRFFNDLTQFSIEIKGVNKSLALKNNIAQGKSKEAFEGFDTELENLKKCLNRLAYSSIVNKNPVSID